MERTYVSWEEKMERLIKEEAYCLIKTENTNMKKEIASLKEERDSLQKELQLLRIQNQELEKYIESLTTNKKGWFMIGAWRPSLHHGGLHSSSSFSSHDRPS